MSDREEDDDEDFVPGQEEEGAEAEKPARKKPRRSQFIDDEAGVEEDDDDEDANRADGGRARDQQRRGGRSRFIDDEVEVEDEESEEDEEDEPSDEELPPDEDDEVLDADQIRRQNEELRRKQREEDLARLEKEVNERYAPGRERVRYPAEDAARAPRDDIRRHAELPGMADPRLFLLRCKPGHEHEVVIYLMQKCANHRLTPEALAITSAVATAIKGYVYIEAYKEAHVRAAIQQIRNLFASSLKLVPLGEMTEVLRMPSKAERADARLQVGSWVRLKRPAEYKGDLASVLSVDDVQATGEITVRVIPRLDYTALARDPADEGARKRSGGARPAARLFSFAEAQNAGFEPYTLERGAKHNVYALERPRDYASMRFEDGFLIRTMKIAQVATDASPTADEVEVFRSMLASVGKADESAALLQGMERAVRSAVQHAFAPGDTVRVIEGDLTNLTCTVVRVHADGALTCLPHHDALTAEVELKASQVVKHFRMGDHCQVLRGAHAGESGLIVGVSGDSVSLFSDLSKVEIAVRAADLTEAAEVSAGRETLGAYALYDLVSLDVSSVGVIVKVEHSSFKVLGTNGIVRTVPLAEVGHKRASRGAIALDSRSASVSVGDVLGVDDGRQGVVKHLFKSFVFLHSREASENAGVFVVRARQTTLVNGAGARAPAYQGQGYGVDAGDVRGGVFQPMSPSRNNANPGWGGERGGRGGGRGGGFGARGRGRSDDLQNAYVRITAGPYKGLYASVKATTDGVARVELTAKSKVVTVDKSKLVIVDRAGEAGLGGGGLGAGGGLGGGLGGGPMGGAGLGLPTPLRDDGFRTPMRDFAYPSTPMRDGSVPMTPMRDGELSGADPTRTPSRVDPWDPTKTPMHDPWSASANRTPSHSVAAWEHSSDLGSHSNAQTDDFAPLHQAPQWPPPRPAEPPVPSQPASVHAAHNAWDLDAHARGGWDPIGRRAPPPPPPPPPHGGFGGRGGVDSLGNEHFSAQMGGSGPIGMGAPSPMHAGAVPSWQGQGMAPGAMLLPPGGGGGAGDSEQLGALPAEIEVRVVHGPHAGKTGKITQVRAGGDVYVVVLMTGGGVQVVELGRRDLEVSTPGKRDSIVIIHGDLANNTGTLIGVDGTDGIVKMDTANGDIKIVELRSCAKLVSR